MIGWSIIYKFWKTTGVAVFVFFLIQNLSGRTNTVDVPALIPMPQKITRNQQNFKIEGNKSRIIQRIAAKLPEVPINQDEAYILKVDADSLILQAKTPMGLFRGQQTISQLTFTEGGKQVVAGCEITDWPAFQIRGFMQDVGRNFMSLPMLKEQIDVMAAYKFNVFHFHVTDNPAWRLESKKYPELKDQKIDCWIGFQDWSRSGGRRGGPFLQQGQWHTTNPKVWVNGKIIEPPVWENAGLAEKTEEIPFSDENYFNRKPVKIVLRKGWNPVLLKVPHGGNSWKQMFTFLPVRTENNQVKEIEGLKFEIELQ